MKRLNYWFTFVLTCSMAAAAFGQPYDGGLQSEPLFRSYFESSNRIGNELTMIQGDLFLTTLQTDRSLLFVDLRTNWVDPEKWEGNFGLGWRGITDAGYILGSYVYYDRARSNLGNYFSQATVGVEMMSINWDFRANGYFPQTGGEITGPPTALFNGTTFVVETPTEFAYYGTDLEIGRLLACTDDGQVELRAFATGYYFDRNKPGYEEIVGGRGRLELRMYDLEWLGMNSRVMVGAQYQYDDVRKDVTSGLVTVRIPFGSGTRQPDRLQRRITDSIVRDTDIVSRTGNLREKGINPETGNPFGAVTVIDGSSDAVAAVSSAQSHSLIVVDGSAGDVNVAAPLIMKDGQTLRSAGFMVMGEQSKRQARFGSPGTIVGTNPTQNVVVLANNVELREVTIRGGLNNLFGSNITDFNIHDSRFLGAAQFGILTNGPTVGDFVDNIIRQGASPGEFRGLFARNEVTANSTFGLHFDSLNGTVRDNTLNGTTSTVIDVTSMAGGKISENTVSGNFTTGVSVNSMSGGEISENIIDGAAQDAFSVTSLGGGTITNNTAMNSGRHGFNIAAMSSGVVSNNNALGNAGSGYEFGAISSTLVDGEISDNRASFNNLGFSFNNISGSPSISENSAIGNTTDGFRFVGTTDALWFDNNTSNSNGGNGFNIGDLPNGFITNNVGNGNASAGMLVGDITNGSISNNSFANNGGGGLILGDLNVGTISNNTMSNNTGVGFSLGLMNNGTVSNNTSTGNTSHGFAFTDFDFGTVESNTASNNGGHGFQFGRIGAGSLLTNTASSNTLDGFRIDTFDSTALSDVSGNVADNNGDDGFDIGAVGGWSGAGQLNNNTATNNTNFGFNIQNRTGGTASGNNASGNGDNTLP